MRSAPRALPERTFWIEEKRLMGGAYPGDLDPDIAREKISALLQVGVQAFLNLTEPDERGRGDVPFAPYEPIAAALASKLGIEIECARLPIVDQSIPSVDRMREIQAWIDVALARKRPCFVHCWGGKGRTGTVAGVYLIRRGLATPDSFEDVIRELRVSDAGGGRAPENSSQCNFVRRYPFSAL